MPKVESAMNDAAAAPTGTAFRRPAPSAMAALIDLLAARFGARCSTAASTREQHANTVTGNQNQPPDAVVFAQSTAEVVEIVKACAAVGAPVIAFGTGTSLEGQVNAPFGGVCIDLSQMAAIKAVHAEDLDCVIEPGVTRKALNAHLRDSGLFFPIDPGADASLGGMAATRASGTNAVRYGTMKDAVLGLTAVTASGEIVKLGGRARKSSAGYDLTRLFVGAEGTLGIITELTLKLSGLPEAVSGGVCPFPSVRAACDAVIMTIQTGLPVARIELLDAAQVRAVNAYSKLTLAETPTLFLEFHGTDASVKEQSERFGEIAENFEGGPFSWATNPEDRTKLWQARHDAYWAAIGLEPGKKGISTDVCVPISRLADCVEATAADIKALGLVAPIVGHVGDGNFHCLPLFDPENAEEVGRVKTFVRNLVERAIAMEGTCTGEHGVGQGKAGYLPLEFPPGTIAMMRAVKQALDPAGIMNPGKIFL
jgi:D-lactate dehydrogenase (cytochrome)